MSNSTIKLASLRPLVTLATLCLLFLSGTVSAQSRKELRRRAADISYQQAGGSATDVKSDGKSENEPKVKSEEKLGESNDPNATVVRAEAKPQSNSRLTPTQRKICELTNSKADLQEEIDQLGVRLQKSRGSKSRKIMTELELLASKMALIDRQLAAIPKEIPIKKSDSDNKPLHSLVDSLVDSRIQEQGYLEAARIAAAAESSRIVYHVQLSVTARPNLAAFSNLSGVEMQRRPDGKYAYYYGNYSNSAQAQSACRRIRAKSSYRDAFVVALRGTQRISIQEAAVLLSR